MHFFKDGLRRPFAIGFAFVARRFHHFAAGNRLLMDNHRLDVLVLKAAVRFAGDGKNFVRPGFGIIFHRHARRHLPVFRFHLCQSARQGLFCQIHFLLPHLFRHRVRKKGEVCRHGIQIPEAMEFGVAPARSGIGQLELERITAVVRKRIGHLVWIRRLALCIEILRADMERLMNIADKMCEENERDRSCNFAIVSLGEFSFQHLDAETHHVDDVPLAAPDFAVAILFIVDQRDIGVVEPMVRWHR